MRDGQALFVLCRWDQGGRVTGEPCEEQPCHWLIVASTAPIGAGEVVGSETNTAATDSVRLKYQSAPAHAKQTTEPVFALTDFC